MDRGEFLGVVEGVGSPEAVDAASARLKARLLESVMASALAGRKWAAIAASARVDSCPDLFEMHHSVLVLSDFMQMEGFQTDEGRLEQDGYSYHQLTVFWEDGKAQYESEYRLGEVDLGLTAALD